MEPVMQWLSRAWHSGEVNEDESREIDAAYERHLREIFARLPDGLRRLNGQAMPDGSHLTLHESRFLRCEWDLPERLTLMVSGHDTYDRARTMTLTYSGAVEVRGGTTDEIATWAADDRTELIYQEVDVLDDGRFEHRHLLWPDGEFAVRFEDLALEALADTAAPPPPSDRRST